MNTADFDILTVACVDLHVNKSTLKLIENNTWQARNGISIQVFNSISNSALEEKFHISQHPSVIIFVSYQEVDLIHISYPSFKVLNGVSNMSAADWQSQAHVHKIIIIFYMTCMIIITGMCHKNHFMISQSILNCLKIP